MKREKRRRPRARRIFAIHFLMLGGLICALFLSAALLSLIWVPFDVSIIDIPARMQLPSSTHWFGTDHFGRDIFSMLLTGARTSIAVALVAVVVGMGVGVPLGLLAAAYSPSLIDDLIMRTNDLIFAFPAILLAIMITTIFGPGAINAIIAVGIFNIPVFARITRGGAMMIWPYEFILAARATGKGGARISVEHILPNISHLLLVQATIQFSIGILAEAALSYIGLGAQPPLPSWGRMLADSQTMVYTAPHLAIFPGLAIVLLVLGLNLFGDGLRDFLDPKIQKIFR